VKPDVLHHIAKLLKVDFVVTVLKSRFKTGFRLYQFKTHNCL
jgi:hypothetical protein